MNDMMRALRTAEDLVVAGLLPDAAREKIARVGAKYAIALTPAVAELIDRADPNDPIALQFVPGIRELDTHPAELTDPIGDNAHSPVPGIVHRYKDRVLLKIASVCPIYCRFCFRREMVGPDLGEAMSPEDIANALAYIRANPQIWEVILTGGDPFVLSPRRIEEITTALGQIPHVKILRWHTRVPVVDPLRVTDEVIEALTASAKTVVVAVHTNHPRELTPEARTAIARLADAGIQLLSQTVLLKGINDNADTLESLMRALVENRVKPYYLHHGDLAPGTAHFRTTIAEGQAIMRELRRRLSGIALPTYVLDIPGGYGKVEIDSNVTRNSNGTYTVRDPNGGVHTYMDAIER
jgi:lysine 2,3-aminomutase